MKKYFDKTFWVSLLIAIALLLLFQQTQGGLAYAFSKPANIFRFLGLSLMILIPFILNYLFLQYSLGKGKLFTFFSVVAVPFLLIFIGVNIVSVVQGYGFILPFDNHIAISFVITGGAALFLYMLAIYLFKKFTTR